ncbi:helix-turn-helix transcriptional regulator [Patescibacteria group bacterium]|nr:helix-turn-helix transcriptional regulator [Patescibacteria group bacterium]
MQNTRVRVVESSKRKTPLQLERCVKGVANHYRISILFLLAEHSGMTLDQIVQKLDGNEKTFSEHTRKLQQAGLIMKKYRGTSVEHSLCSYGKLFYNFLTSL